LNYWTSIEDKDDFEEQIIKPVAECKDYVVQFRGLRPFVIDQANKKLTYKSHDRFFIQLLAWSPIQRNDGRVGLMKMGDCFLTMQEVVNFANLRTSLNSPEQQATITKNISMKTYEPHNEPYNMGTIDFTLVRTGENSLISFIAQNSLDIESESNKSLENYETGITALGKYLDEYAKNLNAISQEDINPEIKSYECHLFFAETIQPVMNFFHFPLDLYPQYKAMIRESTFCKLFEHAEERFFTFLDLKEEQEAFKQFRITSKVESNEKRKEYFVFACLIYLMAISYVPQAYPYVADEAVKSMSSRDLQNLQTIQNKCFKPIESFQDLFRLLCGDCEDKTKAILMMHSHFLALRPIVNFELYSDIAGQYVALGNFGTVTAAKPSNLAPFKNVTRKSMEGLQVGGHVFGIFIPFAKVQSVKSFGLQNPFDVSEKWSKDFEDLRPFMPRLLAEGTAYEFPLFGSWEQNFTDDHLKKRFRELHMKAIEKSKLTRMIVERIDRSLGDDFEVNMISHDTEKDVQDGSIGSNFYRYGKQAISPINYHYNKDDPLDSIWYPTEFCWTTKDPKDNTLKKGALVCDMLYEQSPLGGAYLIPLAKKTQIDKLIEHRRLLNMPPPRIHMIPSYLKSARFKLFDDSIHEIHIEIPEYHRILLNLDAIGIETITKIISDTLKEKKVGVFVENVIIGLDYTKTLIRILYRDSK
jgi:hypothetical protein